MDAKETFARYAALIKGLGMNASFQTREESATAIQVERGTILSAALDDPKTIDPAIVGRLIELSRQGSLARFAVVDATGHHRPVYRALLVYAFLQSFRLAYETLPQSQFGQWEEAGRAWADLLEDELGQITWDQTSATAARGSTLTELAWTGLALHIAGKVFIRDAWTDLASDVFGKITLAQQPTGAFLLAKPSDNPETHWYHELVILHAAASYAVQAEDRSVAAAVQRNALFHLKETQPDHATADPWALFAFIWEPQTRPLADQLLHAAQTQHPQGPSGVAAILLADALLCLRLFVP